VAPSEVPGDTTMSTTIYFSGLSQPTGERISVTGSSQPITVIKGFLSIYQNDISTPLFDERGNPNHINPMTVFLNGAENITNASGEIAHQELIPSIIFLLKDKN